MRTRRPRLPFSPDTARRRVAAARPDLPRPLALLLIRAAADALLSVVVLHLIPGQPAAPALVTGQITWFVLTARADLTPHRDGDDPATGTEPRLG